NTLSSHETAKRQWSGSRLSLVAAVLLLGSWWLFDEHRLTIISNGRAAAFENFSRLDLSDLRGMRGLAWDVGMVGFFTDATILDADGLVNGRKSAQWSYPDRLKRLTTTPVDFVFADTAQLAQVATKFELHRWTNRGEFD